MMRLSRKGSELSRRLQEPFASVVVTRSRKQQSCVTSM
jgi:hypothetical protein